jgi:hypothetical protein
MKMTFELDIKEENSTKSPYLVLFPSAPTHLQRTVPRCQALSRRTKLQCGAASVKGKRVCKWHGGLSTGPKTAHGWQRCAEAKTIHGTETRAIRARRSAYVRDLRILAELGEAIGVFQAKKGA